MAVTTRTLKDTVVNAAGAGGKVTVLVNFTDSTDSNETILDASGLDGHANGAKLDDNKNYATIEFKGASSDTVAIRLSGTGHYDGTAGPITNNATNTTATSGDLELTVAGASGSIIIELRKDVNFTS